MKHYDSWECCVEVSSCSGWVWPGLKSCCPGHGNVEGAAGAQLGTLNKAGHKCWVPLEVARDVRQSIPLLCTCCFLLDLLRTLVAQHTTVRGHTKHRVNHKNRCAAADQAHLQAS